MALLEIDTLSIAYEGRPALTSLTINIARGQSFGIAGATGSGKTTLALALGGLLPPAARVSGAIRFDGSALPAAETAVARLRGQRIAFLFGDGRTALDPLRTIRDQLGHPEVLKDTGLDGALYPHQLSAAGQRRALVALAVAQQPDILVADEPAHGLDAVGAREVLDLLAALQKRQGFALLLLSRDYRAIALCCSDAMVLHAGRAVELGEPATLFGRPQHDYSRALIAAGRIRPRTLTRSPIGTDLLTLRDVSFALPSGGTASLNFAIRRGEALGIVAAPRSGKTRLARIVAGLERARSGLIVLDHDSHHGDDLPAPRRHEISMVFARPGLSFDPRLAVGTSLSEPLRLEPHRTIEEQADRLVETVRSVGLSPQLLRELPAALGPEQLYRFAVARALIARPRLVIVDDPADGFDAERRNGLIELLNRVRSDYSLTLLVLTAQLDIARALADRALIMENGAIVEEGRPAELIDAPAQAATQALVRARLPDIAGTAVPPVLG
jgi:peptide/nickel transport system ATP-binding protein